MGQYRSSDISDLTHARKSKQHRKQKSKRSKRSSNSKRRSTQHYHSRKSRTKNKTPQVPTQPPPSLPPTLPPTLPPSIPEPTAKGDRMSENKTDTTRNVNKSSNDMSESKRQVKSKSDRSIEADNTNEPKQTETKDKINKKRVDSTAIVTKTEFETFTNQQVQNWIKETKDPILLQHLQQFNVRNIDGKRFLALSEFSMQLLGIDSHESRLHIESIVKKINENNDINNATSNNQQTEVTANDKESIPTKQNRMSNATRTVTSECDTDQLLADAADILEAKSQDGTKDEEVLNTIDDSEQRRPSEMLTIADRIALLRAKNASSNDLRLSGTYA